MDVVLASLDFDAAWWGMKRDVSELMNDGGWPIVGAVFLLPVVSIALLLRRKWLGVVPLLASIVTFASWFLYYAIDLWDEVWDDGIQDQGAGEIVVVGMIFLCGWLVVPIVALLRPGLRGQLGWITEPLRAAPQGRPPESRI